MVRTVSRGIAENQRYFIKWPDAAQCADSVQRFQNRNGFPGVIGAIDGTHIPIQAPQENPNAYINYKKFFSVILQAVVDGEGKFIDVFCGYPGAAHDRGVFNHFNPLLQEITGRKADFIPDQEFHILGDGAYPLFDWLLVPYTRVQLIDPFLPSKRNYNYHHSSTRCAVEHAFGHLKGRFRRFLDCAHLLDVRWATIHVVVACCLHNICVDDRQGYEFLSMTRQ